MKTVVITDLHLGIKQSNDVFEEHILNLLERVIDHCHTNSIDHILCLGDLFDVRKQQNTKTLEALKRRFFDRLLKENITFVGVPGNHDSFYKNHIRINSMSIHLREYSNVTVYTEPTVHLFPDGSNLLLVPWISPDDAVDFLEKINDATILTSACAGHFEFSGFSYQRGVIATHGMDSEHISSRFDVVLSGHYHSKSSRGNVTYLGTAYDLTWSDFGEDKFFHEYDTKTHVLTPIHNDVSLFHKIFYEESAVDAGILDELRSLSYKNKVVKVIVRERTSMPKFDSFMDILYSQNPFSIDIIDETIIDVSAIKTEMSEMLSQSTLEIIYTILDEIEVEGYDKDKVKTIMTGLFEDSAAC